MISLEQVRHLQTSEGTEVLTDLRVLAPTPSTTISIAARLRKTYPADLVIAAMQMHELRVRARAKFSRADELWFTRDGLEQATPERVAAHRASRFAGAREIVDLCCGIGGDLIALAAANPGAQLTAVDRDPLHLSMAEANARVAGCWERVTFVEDDVRAVSIPPDAEVFIDPARRAGQGRLATGASDPPLDWCFGLAARDRAVAIKAAPGLPHERVPAGWEIEAVALGSDLKEIALWSPARARAASTATVIDDRATHQLHSLPGDEVPVRAPERGDTLLDPNPAVTRAGLVADLARSLGAGQIDPQIAFLVSATPVLTPFARSLRVVASLPWHERELKRVLRDLGAGPVDIRRRGLAGDVDAIARRLRGTGNRPFTIAMTRVQDQPWAIICERWMDGIDRVSETRPGVDDDDRA